MSKKFGYHFKSSYKQTNLGRYMRKVILWVIGLPFALAIILSIFQNDEDNVAIQSKSDIDQIPVSQQNVSEPSFKPIEALPESATPTQNGNLDRLWVNTNTLNRRTCASQSCGKVGFLLFRESAQVFERKGEWVRITKYYDASCKNGYSEYVDAGNKTCTSDNGIVDGQFAEWVSAKYLSIERPADPAQGATGMAKVISQSDDYTAHKEAFILGAENLIVSGRCTAQDIESAGGFVRSVNRGNGYYFTYCGNFEKYYLNARSGEISKN